MSTLSNFDSTVNSFYLAFYGRPADPAGLKFWSQQLAANNGELGAITQAFATSEEAQVRFGNDSLDERISEIYQQLFNRTIDPDGLAYWRGAVEQGSASLADVSIAILKGARDTDASLSALRQKAADDFTAQVEASGSQYSGYASIEAARILVRAVTANATEADVAQLVKSAVSFADTATKNPAVVEAIAVNTTLLALFDTTRGKGDPVALAQALSDTAKAAAGDPVTLESLLRGGGMDKVLKVMPAAATLKDVVAALGKGGLPAAVEVVYPTKPVAESGPAPVLKLNFVSVSQGEFDIDRSDNITNVKNADVKFSYPGADPKNGEYFQYSIDGGKNWNLADFKIHPEAKIVTVMHVSLTGKDSLINLDEFIEGSPGTAVTNNFQLRLLDSAKKQLAFGTKEIIYDGIAPNGELSFEGIDDGAPGDNTTTSDNPDVTFMLSGAGDDAIVQWRLKGGEDKWQSVSKFDHGSFTLFGIDLSKSEQTIEVRLIDAAGNIGDTMEQTVLRSGNEQLPELPQLPDPQPQPPETNIPPASAVVNIFYRFTPGPTNSLDIFSTPSGIVKAQGEGSASGFIDKSGFSFFEIGHGAPAPVSDAYMSGPFFGVRPNGLNLGLQLEAGFYEMGWKANTIATGTGTLKAESFMFAGGHINGQIYQQGFTVTKIASMFPGTNHEANDARVSSAFIVDKGIAAFIHTGGGNDVVINNGGDMTIVYDAIKHADHDFIQGFSAEGDDKIQFEGDALVKIDRDGDLKLQWASNDTSGAPQLTAHTEAVDFVINSRILTEQVNMVSSETLQTLSNAMHDQQLPETLLILARSADGKGGILIHFEDSVKNGKIDANELSVIATFDDGVPNQDDIVLIGIPGGI